MRREIPLFQCLPAAERIYGSPRRSSLFTGICGILRAHPSSMRACIRALSFFFVISMKAFSHSASSALKTILKRATKPKIEHFLLNCPIYSLCMPSGAAIPGLLPFPSGLLRYSASETHRIPVRTFYCSPIKYRDDSGTAHGSLIFRRMAECARKANRSFLYGHKQHRFLSIHAGVSFCPRQAGNGMG